MEQVKTEMKVFHNDICSVALVKWFVLLYKIMPTLEKMNRQSTWKTKFKTKHIFFVHTVRVQK